MSRRLDSLTSLPDWKLSDPQSAPIHAERSRRPARPTRQVAVRAAVRSALSSRTPLRERFESCTSALVLHLNAAAARIWLITRGGHTLVLQASSSARPAPGGAWPHIPVASPALKRIVETGAPYVTADAVNDPLLNALDWAPGDKMAYAGYPLLAGTRVVGVMGIFSSEPLGRATLGTVRAVAAIISHATQHTLDQVTLDRNDACSGEAQRVSSLFVSLRDAIGHSRIPLDRDGEMQIFRDRYARLSRREREIMALVVAGCLNKEAGDLLGISEITVKVHRGHVMRKMNAYSLADLVKIAVLLQIVPLP